MNYEEIAKDLIWLAPVAMERKQSNIEKIGVKSLKIMAIVGITYNLLCLVSL